ncbi:hypothetical protein TNCV_4126211 [Trichonephila clavipes]|nr:hypothetical protein TNCV_4126211 [Trichonephila clavipes]
MLSWVIWVFLSGTRCSEKVGKVWKTTTAPDAFRLARPTKTLLKNLLNRDRRMGIRMTADELSVPQTQVFEIVTGTLAMRSIPRSGVSNPAQCGNAVSSPLHWQH